MQEDGLIVAVEFERKLILNHVLASLCGRRARESARV